MPAVAALVSERSTRHSESSRPLDDHTGLSFDVHIYINRRGNGTVVVNGPQGVNVPFGNVGQGIAVMAELMGKKAVVAARKKG